jgi:hypothetical protein
MTLIPPARTVISAMSWPASQATPAVRLAPAVPPQAGRVANPTWAQVVAFMRVFGPDIVCLGIKADRGAQN